MPTMTSTSPNSQAKNRLLRPLAAARTLTDDLFQVVHPEALYDRPIPERHRIVFYLGHLEAFDWNLLAGHVYGLDSFHPQFDRLFAFGIDPVDGGLPTDQPSDWPRRGEIQEYNARARERLDARLERDSLGAAEGAGDAVSYSNEFILNVAIEHRVMHAETLAYLLHQLPLNRKVAPQLAPPPTAVPIAHKLAEVPTGNATLGSPRTPQGCFGWDNEFEEHTVKVPAFAIDAYKVTNAQFLEFVRQGGYEQASLWTNADWDWIQAQGIQYPQFWVKRGDTWFSRTMFAEIPLPPEWPVYVSHAEAAAYARWTKKALPSEAQWHRAAYGTSAGVEPAFPWGDTPPEAANGNFDFHRWDPTPVNAHPAGRSSYGVEDLLGNGWEWTSTLFEPFPGFRPFPFYPGYSANFFDGKHYVMKGGSARTAACMVRRSYRNWFQPRYPYVYAAFRCVSS
jgi:gamma-glutamyl hercynylcysteine S-oxide synthase